MQLLNIDANPKTIKGRRKGYVTAVLYLAPSDSSGTELCGMADIAGCKVGCLNTAGRGGMAAGNATFTAANGEALPDNAIQKARLARTDFYLSDRAGFMLQLVREIERAKRYARRKRKKLVVRLNGTSDIRWESVPCIRTGKSHANLFAAFSELQFYDYTKLPNRKIAGIANYHLTFSYSHRDEFAPIVARAVRFYGTAVNFAAVFAKSLPAYFLGRSVVNGDESDLRFLDTRGVVVGLVAKGRARRDTSGFVVPAMGAA
jgi:hypothetical protein